MAILLNLVKYGHLTILRMYANQIRCVARLGIIPIMWVLLSSAMNNSFFLFTMPWTFKNLRVQLRMRFSVFSLNCYHLVHLENPRSRIV